MIKKNSINPIKLLQYYKLINHNLIYNNKAINRYKNVSSEISADKIGNLERLTAALKRMQKTWCLVMAIQNQK